MRLALALALTLAADPAVACHRFSHWRVPMAAAQMRRQAGPGSPPTAIDAIAGRGSPRAQGRPSCATCANRRGRRAGKGGREAQGDAGRQPMNERPSLREAMRNANIEAMEDEAEEMGLQAVADRARRAAASSSASSRPRKSASATWMGRWRMQSRSFPATACGLGVAYAPAPTARSCA